MTTAPQSGLVALDVVLRNCTPSLPDVVVRVIRRFADKPLLVRLHRAAQRGTDVVELHELVEAHHADLRLEARERNSKWTSTTNELVETLCGDLCLEDHEHNCEWMPKPRSLSDANLRIVNDIAVHAASIGSNRVVKWALTLSPNTEASRVLRIACTRGDLELVRAVQHWRKRYVVGDEVLLQLAAEHGHLEVAQHIEKHARGGTPSPKIAAKRAARNGHIDVLEWIHATRGVTSLPPSLLAAAAANGQQSVMQWILDHPSVVVDVSGAMEAAAAAQQNGDLEWLHDVYAIGELRLETLQRMSASTTQRDLAAGLVARFPDRYGDYIVEPHDPHDGGSSGELRIVKRVIQPMQKHKPRGWGGFVTALQSASKRAFARAPYNENTSD